MIDFDKEIEKYKREMMALSRKSRLENKVPENKTTNDVHSETGNVIISNEKDITSENHFGALKVIVFAGNEAFPVEAAKVEVYNESGGVLYSLLTNSGGIAEGMILKAPSKTENDSPDGDKGYSEYSVKVSHPDFDTEIFDDVQIYEGIETIQQVFFTPENMISENEGEYDE